MSTPFHPGRVISRSLSILASNAGAFVLMTLVIHLPVVLLDLYFTTLEPPVDLKQATRRQVIAALIAFLPQAIATAAVTYGVLQHLRGKVAGFAECSRFAFQRLLPVLGVLLASRLLIVLGCLACIAPGIFISCVLFVAVPVGIFEGGGLGVAFARSNELTQGRRGAILGLQLFALGVTLSLASIAHVATFKPAMATAGEMPNASRALVLASDLIGVFLCALHAVLGAVAYHDLRAEREGMGANEIASAVDGGSGPL